MNLPSKYPCPGGQQYSISNVFYFDDEATLASNPAGEGKEQPFPHAKRITSPDAPSNPDLQTS